MSDIDYQALSIPQLRRIIETKGVVLARNLRKSKLVKLYEQHVLQLIPMTVPSARRNNATARNAAASTSGDAVGAIRSRNRRSTRPTSDPYNQNADFDGIGAHRTRTIVNANSNTQNESTGDLDIPIVTPHIDLESRNRAEPAQAAVSNFATGLSADVIAREEQHNILGHDNMQSVVQELRALQAILRDRAIPAPAVTSGTGSGSAVVIANGGSTLMSSRTSTTASNVELVLNPVLQTMHGPTTTVAAAVPTIGGYGVSSDSLPMIEPVSQALRQKIISGKDVSMVLLLAPDPVCDRVLENDGEAYILRPATDPRATKALTITEFITAFSRYKSIMTEVYPHRLPELDAYLSSIIDMSTRFGGSLFYEYHKQFSKRSEIYLERHIKIDWSVRDNNMYCSIFGGARANACALCSSLSHVTKFCAMQSRGSYRGQVNNSASVPSQSSNFRSNPSQLDFRGRNRVLHQGAEICNNYNSTRGCSKMSCKFKHICLDCKRDHPQSTCQIKSNTAASANSG
jgi:hypothetical protein